MKSPVVLLSSLLDDIERLEVGVKGLDRDLQTIKLRFKDEGYGFLTVALPALCDALDRGLADGRFICPSHFKKRKALPCFTQGLLNEIFDIETGILLDKPSISAVVSLRQLYRCFKKLTVQPKREAKLHAQAVSKFIECDNSITDISDASMNYYIDKVSSYILQGLYSYNPFELMGKHGPGNVAEGYKTNQKWSALLDAVSKHDIFQYRFGFDCVSFNTADHKFTSDSKQLIYTGSFSDGPTGISRLVSVPKNSTSRRTITIEPSALMFIQQGLNTVLRDAISQCRIMSKCLDLSSQVKNQHLALEGSISARLATIDLSSASDRLSLHLVEKVFSRKPEFLQDLLVSRSKWCDCEQQSLLLRKYAGMGNATTFPVQSVVFALLAICCILQSEGKEPSYWNALRTSRLVRVYGDDIIIPSNYVANFDRWLTCFGLKINHNKSFSTGFFRESCGVDAFHGSDVTPTYIQHWTIDTSGKQVLVSSLVASSNQLWLKGYYKAGDFLKQYVEELVGSLPFVSKKSEALGWHSRVDTSVAHKWDEKLQRLVFRARVVQPLRKADQLDGYAGLYSSLIQGESRRSCDHLDLPLKRDYKSSIKRFHNRFRWRWLPAYAG